MPDPDVAGYKPILKPLIRRNGAVVWGMGLALLFIDSPLVESIVVVAFGVIYLWMAQDAAFQLIRCVKARTEAKTVMEMVAQLTRREQA